MVLNEQGGCNMKTQHAVTLAIAAGFGLAAITVHGLHAQAKPPVYYVAEIDVTNPDAYAKEYPRRLRPSSKLLAVAN
jgi:hypothetical protein